MRQILKIPLKETIPSIETVLKAQGLPKTAHTKNPVEFIYVADDYQEIKLKDKGILADIAPTILALLKIEQPQDMTARNLII